MAKVEFGMTQFSAGKPLARRSAAAAALAAIAFCASACSMVEQFNPFGAEKYKMEIVPDVPASKIYDQGLEKLANGSPQEAAKKFTDLGKEYPRFGLGPQGIVDDDLRRLSGRRL